MSILSILDDINDGVTDGITPIAGVGSIVSEGIQEITPIQGNSKINLAKLDPGLIQKFNTLYERCIIRKVISKLERVERSVAIEAMATLPARSPVNEAKLTTGASAINKKILDDIVFSEKDEMPADLHEYLQNTFTVFNESVIQEIDNLLNYLIEYVDKLRPLVNVKYKTSIVMYENKSYNLLSHDLTSLVYCIKDTELMHDKYANALSKKVAQVVNSGLYEFNQKLQVITQGTVGKDDSAIGIISSLDCVIAYLRAVKDSVSMFVASARYYIDQNNTELTAAASEAVSCLEKAIKSVESYNDIYSVINEDSPLLKELSDYVEFID